MNLERKQGKSSYKNLELQRIISGTKKKESNNN